MTKRELIKALEAVADDATLYVASDSGGHGGGIHVLRVETHEAAGSVLVIGDPTTVRNCWVELSLPDDAEDFDYQCPECGSGMCDDGDGEATCSNIDCNVSLPRDECPTWCGSGS